MILICEEMLRILPLSARIGWNRVPTIAQRIDEFSSKGGRRIVCLGDSLIEWRAGEAANMLDRTQKTLKGCAVLNLGRSGADVEQYIATYHKFINFRPDMILIFIYLGNDIRKYPSLSDISKLSFTPHDIKQDWKGILKRKSILLSLAFRLLKRYVPSMRSGFFARNVKTLQIQAGLSDNFIHARERQIDNRILELAKSDAINPWIPSMGMIFPRYYKDLFSMCSQEVVSSVDNTLTLIKDFYKEQRIKHFGVVLIPESIQVSYLYDSFFKKSGFKLDDFPLDERRRITFYMQKQLKSVGIKTIDLTTALENEGNTYIELDTHLNAKGHRIAADSIVRFINSELSD
jgi:lysophospholipase L1-like esterase